MSNLNTYDIDANVHPDVVIALEHSKFFYTKGPKDVQFSGTEIKTIAELQNGLANLYNMLHAVLPEILSAIETTWCIKTTNSYLSFITSSLDMSLGMCKETIDHVRDCGYSFYDIKYVFRIMNKKDKPQEFLFVFHVAVRYNRYGGSLQEWPVLDTVLPATISLW